MNTFRKTTLVRATAVLLLLVGLIVVVGARPPVQAAPEATTYNILAIGDSLTSGYDENQPLALLQKKQASYRLPLYGLLENNKGENYSYTFIGKDKQNFLKVKDVYNSYPETYLTDFRVVSGTERNGSKIPYLAERGRTTRQIKDAVSSWANSTNLADNVVVLLQGGTNDIWKDWPIKDPNDLKPYNDAVATSMANLKATIDTLQKNKGSSMTIFVATVIPENQNIDNPDLLTNPRIDDFNTELKKQCTNETKSLWIYKCNQGSTGFPTTTDVYLVDMNQYFRDKTGKFLIGGTDGIHPKKQGEAKMALLWFFAMVEASLANQLSTISFCTDWGLTEADCVKPTPFEGPCEQAPGNMVANCGFSSGRRPWQFYTDSQGGFSVTSRTSYTGVSAARIRIIEPGKNVQLYQTGFALQPNSTYELSFAAYSNNGRDMRVFIHKHGEPYSSYGLGSTVVDLGTDWQLFSITFTTPNREYMYDARLRFWFAPFAVKDTTYFIDEVELVKLP